MPIFTALTTKGLEDILEKELHGLGLEKTKKVHGGISFETNWRGCYKANLCLRSATRVVLPVLEFPAYQPDDIYHNAKKHDFTKYMNLKQTFAVDGKVLDSKIRDQRIVALKLKDAIADQFRDKFDARPNVEKDNPDMQVMVRLVKNTAMVSIDTSGGPLFKRGYREQSVDAPLKEHLAAALLLMSGWDRKKPLIDLMCGSGTFLIEAGMMAMNQAPGGFRQRFAFQNFAGFQKDVFREVSSAVLQDEKEELDVPLFGYDISGKSVKAAKANVRAAELGDWVSIVKSPVDMIDPPELETKGIIVANPPYGERLGSVEVLKDVYRDMAFKLKKDFSGWEFWLLSGEPQLTPSLEMKASVKFPVSNGRIDCRWMKYIIR